MYMYMYMIMRCLRPENIREINKKVRGPLSAAYGV